MNDLTTLQTTVVAQLNSELLLLQEIYKIFTIKKYNNSKAKLTH